jgi:putative ATP-binding cassette transporter
MPGKDQPPDKAAAPRPPAANVLAVFRRHAPLRLAALAVVLGALSGLANTGLIAIINHALSAVRRPGASWVWIFAGLCVVAGIARVFSATLVVQVGARLATELQVSLSRRILAAPLRLLEEIGSHRLLASLVDDVNTVSDAITIVPTTLINSIVVLGCLAYLGWLSPSLLGGVLVVMAIGVLTYQLALHAGYARQRRAREMADELFRHLRGLTLGTKELKTGRRRREDFIDLLEISAQRFRGMRVTAQRIFNIAASWGNLLFFLAIGLILLLPSGTSLLGHETRNGFVLVLLYMSGPLQAVLNSVPMISQSAVALRKIESLGISLLASEDIRPATAAEQKPSWQRLELVGATHTYVRDDGAFTLGPLDLAFEPGELIFVVGGNGSGKTTFAKLLVGLYLPEAGEIRLNGKPVQAEQLDAYRHLFAIVFSDFYLFEKLLGLSPTEVDAAAGYIAKLRLAHQVRIQNGAFSTTALSQGQRKRLALIAALLEDRAMYVFDEWAADQDPEFKVFFYCQILPELMARGKTVFVITHDDRFFDLASRVVKLEDGRVVSDRVPHAASPLASIPAASN